MLAADVDDWVDALLELIDDALLRHRIGHAAREQALLTLSPALQGHRYLEILTAARDSVDRDGHRETFVDWTPEVISEPYIIQPTDEYGPPARGLVVRPRGLSGIRNLGRAARDTGIGAISMLRRDGIVATANKILSVAGALPARAAARRR